MPRIQTRGTVQVTGKVIIVNNKVVHLNSYRHQMTGGSDKKVYIYSVSVDGSDRGIVDVKGSALAFMNASKGNQHVARSLEPMVETMLYYRDAGICRMDEVFGVMIEYVAAQGIVSEAASQSKAEGLHIILMDRKVSSSGAYEFTALLQEQNKVLSESQYVHSFGSKNVSSVETIARSF